MTTSDIFGKPIATDKEIVEGLNELNKGYIPKPAELHNNSGENDDLVTSDKERPPLAVIDAIDKWVHQQTRFHLPDTDGYEEMLSSIAKVMKRLANEQERKGRIDELTEISKWRGTMFERDIRNYLNDRLAQLEQKEST